jgi:hypothetical protein
LSVARKIDLARQLEEAKALAAEPPRAPDPKAADERVARRRAIVGTLEFNLAHEHLIRAFMAERRGDGLRFRLRGGRLCWATANDDSFTPVTEDEANVALARFDMPANGGS